MSANLLESFDEAPLSDPQSLAYDQGFQDGQAAALQLASANQNTLSEELVQNIKDLEFSFAEVRANLSAALAPLFVAICEKLFPALIDEIFARRIVDILSEAARTQAPGAFQLAVHPDQCVAVQEAANAFGLDLAVVQDANLGAHAARIDYPHVAELFDAQTLLDEVADVLRTMTQPSERTHLHGQT